MTSSWLDMLALIPPPDVSVTRASQLHFAPFQQPIEFQADAALSCSALFRAILPRAENHGAFIEACYNDRALISMLYEKFI